MKTPHILLSIIQALQIVSARHELILGRFGVVYKNDLSRSNHSHTKGGLASRRIKSRSQFAIVNVPAHPAGQYCIPKRESEEPVALNI